MSKLKRYEIHVGGTGEGWPEPEESPDGPWMDAEAVEAELARKNATIHRLRKERAKQRVSQSPEAATRIVQEFGKTRLPPGRKWANRVNNRGRTVIRVVGPDESTVVEITPNCPEDEPRESRRAAEMAWLYWQSLSGMTQEEYEAGQDVHLNLSTVLAQATYLDSTSTALPRMRCRLCEGFWVPGHTQVHGRMCPLQGALPCKCPDRPKCGKSPCFYTQAWAARKEPHDGSP